MIDHKSWSFIGGTLKATWKTQIARHTQIGLKEKINSNIIEKIA